MKRLLPLIATLFAIACCAAQNLRKVPLADPFILLYDGVYYAYGTGAGSGIEVWTSRDLSTWERAKGNARDGLALHRTDVWGEKWFWAPEVYRLNDKFYMYFTAEEHICVATSDSPLGPFVQEKRQPMIADEKCIDNTLFIDDDGYWRIGRVAVLREMRGKQLGDLAMRMVLDKALQAGAKRFRLSSQKQAEGFYRLYGFEPTGEETDDCGVPHTEMEATDESIVRAVFTGCRGEQMLERERRQAEAEKNGK